MTTPVTRRRRTTKPSAKVAFDANMADADMLVSLAELLHNRRTNRMRAELRERLGAALRVPKAERKQLECLENHQVFITFKPGSAEWRRRLNQESLRPLLRQAVVAAGAAVETFVADRVMELFGGAIRSDPVPPRLLGLAMTVGDRLRIDRTYTRKTWGLREIAELEVREKASPTPSVIGELFSMVGIRDVFKQIDIARKVPKGTSAQELDEIRIRRNKIAHQGDRAGRGRATITVDEVRTYLTRVRSIVDAMDAVTKKP